MLINHRLFVLLLILAVSSGCHLMDRQSPPNIAETPPYLQPQRDLAQSQQQLAEMRALHEKESARMSENLNTIQNREMERLTAASKELEREKRWQDDYEKTQKRRAKWMSWFTKTDTTNKKASKKPDMADTQTNNQADGQKTAWAK